MFCNFIMSVQFKMLENFCQVHISGSVSVSSLPSFSIDDSIHSSNYSFVNASQHLSVFCSTSSSSMLANLSPNYFAV